MSLPPVPPRELNVLNISDEEDDIKDEIDDISIKEALDEYDAE